MSTQKEHLESIQGIRKMMQESSKFLSLSGFSGVFAGIYALIGAYIGNSYLENYLDYSRSVSIVTYSYIEVIKIVVLICASVLILSIVTAFYFSKRKATKNGVKLFDKTTLKLLTNMAIPLLTGGIFCLALLFHGKGYIFLVSPIMLIFYGLALINGGKYTFHEIKILGFLEIILGLLSAFYIGYGLLFWTIGFGFLHIIYGTLVWFKHERK